MITFGKGAYKMRICHNCFEWKVFIAKKIINQIAELFDLSFHNNQ